MKANTLFSLCLLTLLFSFIGLSPVMGQKAPKKITISGVITDKDSNPIKGATIFIDKKSTNVSSNDVGYYEVKVKPTAQVISAIHMMKMPVEELIDGRSTINFSLPDYNFDSSTATAPSDELVSTIGEEKDNAYYKNVYDMIEGKFPGVSVDGSSIRIAGSFSKMLSTEPLYVVDGKVVNNFDHVFPRDVKKIEILKGSDAAIWGSRGANGVINITLFKGTDRLKDTE